MADIKNKLQQYFAKLLTHAAESCYERGIWEELALPVVALKRSSEGFEHYQNKDYDKALQSLKPIVDLEAKHPDIGHAQYTMGLMYFHGRGVNKDKERAERYFMQAAQRECQAAQDYFVKKSESHIKH